MTKFELFTFSVYKSLGVGHNNALTRRDLCQKLGCGDRALRRSIEKLRENYPVLSLDDGSGYYLADTSEAGRQEAAAWVKRQNSRIKSIKQSKSGAVKFLGQKIKKGFPGQLTMFDAMGGG